jgi:hypothetical protein
MIIKIVVIFLMFIVGYQKSNQKKQEKRAEGSHIRGTFSITTL